MVELLCRRLGHPFRRLVGPLRHFVLMGRRFVLPHRRLEGSLLGFKFPLHSFHLLALVLEVALLVVRGFEFRAIEVRWDDNFYGSMLWTMLGFHAVHIFSDVVETAVLLIISFRKGIKPHRFVDMADNAFFWYFAVWFWLPLFVLIYLVPRWS